MLDSIDRTSTTLPRTHLVLVINTFYGIAVVRAGAKCAPYRRIGLVGFYRLLSKENLPASQTITLV
jgi:hypothetical protein